MPAFNVPVPRSTLLTHQEEAPVMTTVRSRRHRWLHVFWTLHSPLLFSSAVYAVMIVLCTAGLVLDDRVITGVPAWLKPLKFVVSSLMYSLTLRWILNFVRHRPRLVNSVTWANGAALLAELNIILFQAVRGTTSHFNVTTPLNRTLYLIMAGAVGVLWVTQLIVTLVVAFQRFERPSFALSLRLALTLTLIGMSFGFLMVSPLGTLLASGQASSRPSCRQASSAPTASASPMGARVSPSSAGVRSAATCAAGTSSGCMPCNSCPCSRGWSPAARDCPRRSAWAWCGPPASVTWVSYCSPPGRPCAPNLLPHRIS